LQTAEEQNTEKNRNFPILTLSPPFLLAGTAFHLTIYPLGIYFCLIEILCNFF